MIQPYHQLVRLRARPDTLYLSRGRTVLATDREGCIRDGSAHGLFVHETRLLSRYVVLIDGHMPWSNALSNVEQHSWLGYYLVPVPGAEAEPDLGSGQVQEASQHSLEIRISRVVGEGLHEDLLDELQTWESVDDPLVETPRSSSTAPEHVGVSHLLEELVRIGESADMVVIISRGARDYRSGYARLVEDDLMTLDVLAGNVPEAFVECYAHITVRLKPDTTYCLSQEIKRSGEHSWSPDLLFKVKNRLSSRRCRAALSG